MRIKSFAFASFLILAIANLAQASVFDPEEDPPQSLSYVITNSTPYPVTIRASLGNRGAPEVFTLQPGEKRIGYAADWPYQNEPFSQTEDGYSAGVEAIYKSCKTVHTAPVDFVELGGEVHFLLELEIVRTSPGVVRIRPAD